MSRRSTHAAALGLALAAAVALAVAHAGAPTAGGLRLLQGIDHVPSRAELEGAFEGDAAAALAALAADDAVDGGARLRALRALALYPGPLAEQVFADVIAGHADATVGLPLLFLRAAASGLATVAGPAAESDLVPLLDHPARDVRATAAAALATAGATPAIAALRARLLVESVEQVRLALSAAIRELST